MTSELLVTEHDLEQLRAAPAASARLSVVSLSTRVESAEHLWQVVLLVIARAGQATPPGRYVQINGRWTHPTGISSIAVAEAKQFFELRYGQKLNRRDDEIFTPESDSKPGPSSPDPTPMPPDESGSESPLG
jgi:hypothetical protein